MLTVLIYLADLTRRTLRKLRNGFVIVAQSFDEAQAIRRNMPPRYTAE
jgi:hypothetical protein